MTVVADVFTFLEDEGLAGGSTEWDLLRRRIADGKHVKDQLVVVSEDGGLTPEIATTQGIGDSALSDTGVLITVRSKAHDGDAGLAKGFEILRALHGRRNATLGDSGDALYFRVKAMTPEPIFAGFDDENRPLHTIAFRLLSQVVVGS